MPDTNKLTCPDCGAAMNHHAVKIDYGSEELSNSVFEGLLRSIHACPECGGVEMTTDE
jgi:predicted RNA-binding Zn-ribbon protein involved in translation (DUF1610 family)